MVPRPDAAAIRVRGFANAPCSWGVIEGSTGTRTLSRVLDEMPDAGYVGTELGDWGFMPTRRRRAAGRARRAGAGLVGSVVSVGLHVRAQHLRAPTTRSALRASWRRSAARRAHLLGNDPTATRSGPLAGRVDPRTP